MGAEIIVTRSDVGKGHPDYYQDLAADLTARTKGAIYINQFENPANPRAHEKTNCAGNPARRWSVTSTRSWSASAPAVR